MTDPNTADDPTRREEIKADLQQFADELKDEVAQRLDQKLDELGARIGGDQAQPQATE